MRETVLDDFRDLSGWSVFASGEAELRISPDRGENGPAMSLDFDFHGAGGFVVARRALALSLPESYSFGFRIRGSGPRNHLEFKLLDESNRNVWRYRAEAFDLPEAWTEMRVRDRDIEFAWGPLGGGQARSVAFLELVVAAGPGGRGTVSFERLALRDDTYRSTPRFSASSSLPGHGPENALDPSEPAGWRSGPATGPQWFQVDFQEEREFGGLVVHWERALEARSFQVEVSSDSAAWHTAYATAQGGSERSFLYLPDTRARYLRLRLLRDAGGPGFGIRGIEVKSHEFSRSLNHFFESVARYDPPGYFPKYLSGRQTCWTVVGTGEGGGPALMNEEGMVEVDKGSFSLAPFLWADGRLVTWADAVLGQELAKGYLPIPAVTWRTESLRMEVAAFPAGETGRPVLCVRYRVENTAASAQRVALFAAVVPFQVTPTWQNWRSFGGVRPVRTISWAGPQDAAVTGSLPLEDAPRVVVDEEKVLIPLTPVSGFGAAAFAQGGVTACLARGRLPEDRQVRDEFGFSSGALRFDLDLAAGAWDEVVLAVPFGPPPAAAGNAVTELSFGDAPGVPGRQAGGGGLGPAPQGARLLDSAVRAWESLLGQVEIRVPPRARALADTFRTAAAHILINRDGPALHPGPRRYARSWIRDGVLMGAALLRAGLCDPIRDFLRWYRQYIAEDGGIPDCVDRDGAEWLPEHDAFGQFLFGVMEHFRFAGDRAFLEEMRPWAERVLARMEALRSRRLTEEYRTPEKRGRYGLLPESMSHEGYMAHPVHAYWDDFWALQGFRDASALAAALGDRAEADRLARLADRFSEDLRASLADTIARRGIDYVPGSVEFGDFDPAATSLAAGLLGQLPLLPRPEIDRTFDKYMAGFRDRAAGRVDWNNYSAYEVRIAGALVRLGRRQDALDLLTFLLSDRRIPAWNQWPEISWRDPAGPAFIGDLPHTWISAEYVLAVSALFAFEREEDGSLVVGAGVDPAWMDDGFEVGVRNLPTRCGRLSFRMRREGDHTLRVELEGDLRVPSGGVVVASPLAGPLRSVTVNGQPAGEHAPREFACRAWPAHAVART